MINNINYYIADTSMFIEDTNLEIPFNKTITVPSVIKEIKSKKAIIKLELAKVNGLIIEPPNKYFVSLILKKARETNDLNVLSTIDIEILSKSIEYKNSILLTDDFAIQNLASFFNVKIRTISKKKIKNQIVWHMQCIGCKKTFESGLICTICGSKLIKKIKNKKTI